MGLNALFTPGGQRLLFEVALSKLLQATGPWAKGLRVLEAADVTADHVYYVFLGIMSQHEEDFRKNEFGLELRTMEDIRRIANSRFNELVNETPQSHDLYITAFVCNPDYRNAPVYKEINPLSMPTLVISRIGSSVACSTKPPKDMVERAGLGLQRILKHEYGDVYEAGSSATDPAAAMKLRNPALLKYTPFDALNWLRQQFKSYLNMEDPFNHKRRSKQSTLQWWTALAGDELADVLAPLAQKIFAVVPISMTDERTQSTITWLNSPHRSRQEVATLQDHIKIRQWHRYNWDEDTSKALYKPLVSWRDMEASTRGERPEPTVQGDLPLPGYRPPLLQPANLQDSTTGDESESVVSGDLDGILWLNGHHGLTEGLSDTRGDKFTLAGCDGIELRSPWLRDIISSTPRQPQRFTQVPASEPPTSLSSSQLVPSTSAWEVWE